MKAEKQRLALFIDGANNTIAIRKSRAVMDFKKFLKELHGHYDVISANYYSGTSDSEEYRGVQSYLRMVERSGYTLITKPVTRFADGRVKANMDIEIAIDVLKIASSVDRIMLFSGDGDFTCLVQEVQSMGVKVTVCSHGDTISDKLKAQADEYISLESLLS